MTDYLLDHYGCCLLASCRCLADSFHGFLWEGRKCPHWQPFGAKTLDELKQAQKQIKDSQ